MLLVLTAEQLVDIWNINEDKLYLSNYNLKLACCIKDFSICSLYLCLLLYIDKILQYLEVVFFFFFLRKENRFFLVKTEAGDCLDSS